VKVHEALFSIKILLDQFKEGLKKVKVLDLIQSFPEEFAPLFISNGKISANEVVRALRFGSGIRDTIAMDLLKKYIFNLSQEGMSLNCKVCDHHIQYPAHISTINFFGLH